MMSEGLYEEVRDSVGRMFAGGAQDPLGDFGFADLLASEDPAERNAAYAVAEAQGRTLAVTGVVSQVALAGLGLPETAGYATSLGQASSPSLMGLLGHGTPDDTVLLDDRGAARRLTREELTTIASPLDPDYLTVFSHESGTLPDVDIQAMEDVRARARIACSAEILGACETMLADAIRYAGARRQFGAPIASYQAVAHSLAWSATEIRQLRALVRVCLTGDAVRAPDHVLAAVTKSMAGAVSRRVAQTTLQVTGAMGFTWEYSHNASHRRVLALDAVAGSADSLNLELGRQLRKQGGASVSELTAISLPTLAGHLQGHHRP
jgi:hypothetical protein